MRIIIMAFLTSLFGGATNALAELDLLMEKPRSLNPFTDNYITYEFARDTPVGDTKNVFRSLRPNHILGYRHNLGTDWLTGISVGFKSFANRQTDEELSFFSISHESLYIFRLYHPVYLLAGPKFSYMLPSRNAKIPFTKNPDYELEIGAAATAQIAWRIFPAFVVHARVDRWRGTKTNFLHGTETAIGFAVSLF